MKSSISAKIPTELYDKVQEAIKEKKYTSNTECIIEGLNLLLRNPTQENTEIESLLQEKEKEIQNMQEEVNRSKGEIQVLQGEVNRSKGEIQVLQGEVNRSKEEVNRSKEEYTRQIKDIESASREKSAEILRLQKTIQELPDRSEFAELKGLFEGKLQVIEEKDKRIEDLSKEVERLDMFAHYFKNVDIKQIEAPAAEKKKPWYKIW
jgi:Arc/MetJ-type ribon-helix-helix transcriptional regulator